MLPIELTNLHLHVSSIWAIRRPIFWLHKFWHMQIQKTQLFVVNDELAHHPVEKYRQVLNVW